jgi:fermentation-respiration switch protein FrsA (DUF1100 family)
MRNTIMAAALLATALGGCAGTIRERIYRPSAIAAMPVWQGRAPEAVTATTADGLALKGWYWPGEADKPLLIFFHGNGGNRDTAAKAAEAFAADGHGVLVADYRGYGDNPGKPDEAGLFADGEAFVALARRLQPRGRLFLFGWSLGGAVALEMGARHPVDGVVTYGAFARLANMAPAVARGMLPDRFDNEAAVRRAQAPVLLLHGTADEVVPFAEGEKLKAAAVDKAIFYPVEGAGHHLPFGQISARVWAALEAMPAR